MFDNQKLYWKDRFHKIQNIYTFYKINCTLGFIFEDKFIHWNDIKAIFFKKGEKIG